MKKVTVQQINDIRSKKYGSLMAAKHIAEYRNLKDAILELKVKKDLKDVLLKLLGEEES